MLTPAYFGKYFEDGGRLNLKGEVGMSVGILALFFFLSPAIMDAVITAWSLVYFASLRNKARG
jgi:hypothetical protein